MTEPVTIMYNEALRNDKFNTEAKEADPKYFYKPHNLSENNLKVLYATIYYGWLIAKGLYKRENYYN